MSSRNLSQLVGVHVRCDVRSVEMIRGESADAFSSAPIRRVAKVREFVVLLTLMLKLVLYFVLKPLLFNV